MAYGFHPACDDGPRCDGRARDEARGELKGIDIALAIADDEALANKLDALLSLVAAGANDDCDHGRMLRSIVEAGVELAIDAKVCISERNK